MNAPQATSGTVGVSPGRVAPLAPRRGSRFRGIEQKDEPETIVGNVQWTMAFVGLLVFIFGILTFRLDAFGIGNIAMAAALLGVFLQKKSIRFPAPLAVLTLFLLWAVFGWLQTDYPHVVGEEVFNFAKLCIIAFVTVNAVRTPGQTRFFLLFFIFVFATHPARGAIFNYLGGDTTAGRVAWNRSFGNPNDMAALTFLPLAIAVMLIHDRNKWVRLGARASVVVLPIVILLTQSRGAVIALALFTVLVLAANKRKVRSFALVAILGAIAAIAAPTGVWDRMSTLSEEGRQADSSSEQRWLIWQVAGTISRDHAFAGVGLGAYPLVHEVYAATRQDWAFAGGKRDTHSTYLNVRAETGIPGLLLFLGVIGLTLWQTEKARRRVRARNPGLAWQMWLGEASLLAYLAAGIFGSFALLSFLYIHLAVLICLGGLADQPVPAPTAAGPRSRRRFAPNRRYAPGTPRLASSPLRRSLR